MATKPPTASLDQCTPTQLKTLLDLGTRSTSAGDALVRDAEDPCRLERTLTELCAGRAESGALLLETVADPATPVDVLRGIKELAKQLGQGTTSEAHRSAATLLYHAAVAAAAARHDAALSSTPLAERLDLYGELAVVLRDTPLGTVFREAVEHDLR
jgi:hypothetical protein